MRDAHSTQRSAEGLVKKGAALSKRMLRFVGELTAASPRRRTVANETGKNSGEVTLIRETARYRDIRDRKSGVLQLTLRPVDSMALQPLVGREPGRHSKGFGKMSAR